jgi:hypothetical protein
MRDFTMKNAFIKNGALTLAVLIGFVCGFGTESVRRDIATRALRNELAIAKASLEQANQERATLSCESSEGTVVRLKTELLRAYVNFVFRPRLSMNATERLAYVDAMSEKVRAIDDATLAQKYNATGMSKDRSGAVLELLNTLLDDIVRSQENENVCV